MEHEVSENQQENLVCNGCLVEKLRRMSQDAEDIADILP